MRLAQFPDQRGLKPALKNGDQVGFLDLLACGLALADLGEQFAEESEVEVGPGQLRNGSMHEVVARQPACGLGVFLEDRDRVWAESSSQDSPRRRRINRGTRVLAQE